MADWEGCRAASPWAGGGRPQRWPARGGGTTGWDSDTGSVSGATGSCPSRRGGAARGPLGWVGAAWPPPS